MWVSAAPTELDITFGSCIPRVSYRALPSLHPGLCRSAALAGLILPFVLCVPRVSYWASPSFRPGLCRSGVPTALIMRLNFDAVALKQKLLNEWHKSFIFVLLIQYITKTNFF